MRTYWFSLTALALAGSFGIAQAPQNTTRPGAAAAPAASPLDPAHNPLDDLLLRWEQAMTRINGVIAHCTRTSVDKVYRLTEVYEGTAKYMKPNLAMLEMRSRDKPGMFEKYICTGTYFYEYVPSEKVIRVHDLPPPKPGQVADDNFLSFLFGMKAEEAKRRYTLKIAGEDKFYSYVEILPRFQADKQDFQKARLVLIKSSFLPRELWFEQPNGNEVRWDIPKVETGANLSRTEFVQPNPPTGWKLVRAPKTTDGGATQPRIIRQNGK